MGPRSNHIVMGPVVKNGCFCHCSGNKWLSAISMPLSSSMYVKMRTQIYLLVRLPIFFFYIVKCLKGKNESGRKRGERSREQL